MSFERDVEGKCELFECDTKERKGRKRAKFGKW